MSLKAILFDNDGTLANTERYGHLAACNEAFRQLELDLHWTWEEFIELIPISGNARRLEYSLKKRDLSQHEIALWIKRFVPLKKELYNDIFVKKVKVRPGVLPFLKEVRDHHLQIAIVSTSYESQLHAFIETHLSNFADAIDPILGKETGQKTGPKGVLYEKCLELMELEPWEAIVIEDSRVGHEAAQKAGLKTIITYNDYTKNEKFSGASLVVPSMEHLTVKKIYEVFDQKKESQTLT